MLGCPKIQSMLPKNFKDQPSAHSASSSRQVVIRLITWAAGLAMAGGLSLILVVAVALSVAYPNLPDISDLSTYRPKLPMRVFAADGALIGEFGEERRSLTPIKDIPQVMQDAVLANTFRKLRKLRLIKCGAWLEFIRHDLVERDVQRTLTRRSSSVCRLRNERLEPSAEPRWSFRHVSPYPVT